MGAEFGETIATTRSATTVLPNPIFNNLCSIAPPQTRIDYHQNLMRSGAFTAGSKLFNILNLFSDLFKLRLDVDDNVRYSGIGRL